MTGAPMTAERLHQVGLVNRLAEPGGAVADASRWAGELVQRAPAAVAAIKALVALAAWPDLDAQLERERAAFVATMFEPESRAQVAGFLQRSRGA